MTGVHTTQKQTLLCCWHQDPALATFRKQRPITKADVDNAVSWWVMQVRFEAHYQENSHLLFALLAFSSTERPLQKIEYILQGMLYNPQEAALLGNGNLLSRISVAECFLKNEGFWRNNSIRRVDFACMQCQVYINLGIKSFSSEKRKKLQFRKDVFLHWENTYSKTCSYFSLCCKTNNFEPCWQILFKTSNSRTPRIL